MFELFDKFASVSGLKINVNKTELMLLGTTTKEMVDPVFRHLITSGMKILGVTICKKKTDTISMNYPPILAKMKETMNNWSRRRMSICGKIAIIKTLVVPKLVYALTVLPSPPKTFWDEANGLLYKFIHDNKRDKHKRKTLIGPFDKGGLNMVDVETQNASLKIGWMRRLLDCSGIWKDNVIERYKGVDYRYLLQANMIYADIPVKHSDNNVWSEIWAHWCLYNYEKEVLTVESVLNQNIWFNSHIRINKKVVFYRRWYDAGIGWLHHLLDENLQRFATRSELEEKFRIRMNHLEYLSLLRSIPKDWKRKILQPLDEDEAEKEGNIKVIDILEETKKPVRCIYNHIISKIHEPPLRQKEQWAV